MICFRKKCIYTIFSLNFYFVNFKIWCKKETFWCKKYGVTKCGSFGVKKSCTKSKYLCKKCSMELGYMYIKNVKKYMYIANRYT